MVESIQLDVDNPYSTGFVVNYEDGLQSLERIRIVYAPTTRDIYYTIIDGDNLSDLAYKFYGTSKLWWIIADVNQIFDPFHLTVGTMLIIPDDTTIKSQLV